MIGDQPIYNTKDTIKLGSIKALELLCEGADFFGMRRLQIEKFHWGDVQIVTDFKKIGHGRECLIVFNAVGLAGVLPEGKTHIPCGNALCHTQLYQSFGKCLFTHACITSMCHIISNKKLEIFYIISYF